MSIDCCEVIFQGNVIAMILSWHCVYQYTIVGVIRQTMMTMATWKLTRRLMQYDRNITDLTCTKSRTILMTETVISDTCILDKTTPGLKLL